MPVVRLVLAIGCCLLAGVASAQITIVAGDVPQTIGDSSKYKYLSHDDTVDNGSPGGPHTWTFDTSAFVGAVLTTTIVDKATTPFVARFPDANLATKEPRGPYTLYVYNKVETGGLLECGYAMDFGGGKAWVSVPPVVNCQFPATLNTSWQTDYTVTDTLSTDTVDVVVGTRRCTIDAWGTAVTPSGSYDCLRENWTGLAVTTHYVGGTPVGVDTSISRRYLWMAKGVGVVAMTHSMEGDTSPNFTLADDIMVMVQTSSGAVEEMLPAEVPAANIPTVVRGALVLGAVDSKQHSAHRAELLDAAGRTVMGLRAGANDVRALAPGVYFVREAQAQAQAQAVRKVVLTE